MLASNVQMNNRVQAVASMTASCLTCDSLLRLWINDKLQRNFLPSLTCCSFSLNHLGVLAKTDSRVAFQT